MSFRIRSSQKSQPQNAANFGFGTLVHDRFALNCLRLETAFAAGGSVAANHRRATIEPPAATLLAVADVHVAVGVPVVAACSPGDCAFPVGAFSAVAIPVAAEIAAGELQAVPDGLRAVRDDPRLVAPDVPCRAARDDLRPVARDVPHRAVQADLRPVVRDDPYRDVQADLLRDDLHRVVAGLAGRGDCSQGDPGARFRAAERRDEEVGANSTEAGAKRVD